MRTLYAAAALLLALLAGGGTVHAQLPLPFRGQPEPDFSSPAQCTREHVRSVEREVAMLEKLRASGPEAVGQVCTLIEMGSAWLGGELPDDVRRELRSLLGVDIDLQVIKAQCRVGQDNLAREIVTRLARLRSELLRCDDTV